MNLAQIVSKLYHWLEDDRERRKLIVRADNLDIWHAALYIDNQCITAASGYEIVEVLTELLEGMVLLPEPEGIPVK